MFKTELEDASLLLKDIISKFPHTYNFKLSGVDKLITPTQKCPQYYNEQQLIFVKNGKGKYIFSDSDIKLYRGIILYISDHCDYQISMDSEDPLEIIRIRFYITNTNTNKSILVENPFKIGFMPDDILKLGIKYHQFCDNVNAIIFKEIKKAITNSFISEMLIEILKSQQLFIESNINEKIKEGRRIIENNKHKNLSISKIANQIGISERYFRKLFKQTYGLSPKEYHTKVRMYFARFLLLEAKYTIKQVAFEVGYSDIYTFSRQYKVFFGYSPSETSGYIT